MKRALILAALILACLAMAETVLAGPPSSGSFDMGNDIWLTIVDVERYASPTLEQNGLIFDMEAHYYISGTVNVQIEHSFVVLTEVQVAVANAESGANAKMRRACELVMETAPTFSTEMLALRKRLENMADIVRGWITP